MNDICESGSDTTKRVRELNDRFRGTLQGGAVIFTSGILALGPTLEAAILEAVRTFHDFDTDNDPYGEHDFGRIVIGNHEILFKFDYYDLTRAYHSDDPANSEITERVLTIMLACEY